MQKWTQRKHREIQTFNSRREKERNQIIHTNTVNPHLEVGDVMQGAEICDRFCIPAYVSRVIS